MVKKNLLPKACPGTKWPEGQPNTWEKMENVGQFIDDIDTTGGELTDAAKFNLLVSSVPSPWARVHLTQHAIMAREGKNDQRTLSQFYSFLCSEWRGLVAAYVLYPEDFELTEPIDLVSKDMSKRSGKFDILSTYSEMLFENEALWKYEKGQMEKPKMQILYYHNGDQRYVVGGTCPFSILFSGMNYDMPVDEKRIYWIVDGKFQDPADERFATYYKKGEAKFNDKHYNNLKKLYSFLNGVQKNVRNYTEMLKGIWDDSHTENVHDTADARYNKVGDVLSGAISKWMKEIEESIGKDVAIKSENIPVNHKKPAGPLGDLLNIKATYYWRNNAFYTKPLGEAGVSEVVINDVENLFIKSDYLALWKDDAMPDVDRFGKPTGQMKHDYRTSSVHFIKAEENGKTWFLAIPLSEYALDEVFKQELVNIIGDENKNGNVQITAEKNGKRVDVYLKARIDAEGDEWVNIRNRSFNVEFPNPQGKVFAWPNFCSSKWQKYYYYSEFPTNAIKDVQMVPVFEDMVDVEDKSNTDQLDKDVFDHMVTYPATATTDAHAYEIYRTHKPLCRFKIRKRIGNGIYELGWLVVRRDSPQGMQVIPDSDNLSETTVGFDFGSTNSCAYYCGQGSNDIRPIPFSNRRLAIVGFDNEAVNAAEPNELLFISNEEPINKNGQIKSWLHEHNQMFIDTSRMNVELIGGVPVNETNITVKSMNRYDITTNAGKLHYNMKWLVDKDGISRKTAFVKMVWIQICADLFADGLYPKTLNWSYPSAMGTRDMSALGDIFDDIPSPCPEYSVTEKKSFTEAEAVCSYFMDKKVSLEANKLFVGIDIGGSTSDILVLGKETQREKSATGKPAVDAPMKCANGPISQSSVGYEELGRKELCELVRQRGLAGKIDLDESTKSQIADFLKENEAGADVDVDYKKLEREELCELVRQRGLAGKIDLDESTKSQIADFLKGNEAGADNVNTVHSNKAATAQSSAQTDVPKPDVKKGASTDRLFTQCSVRMAAGVFFDAIIGSKKFRDCIRKFHASKETPIKVEDIDTIETDPLRAPYYLNNIFDQLHGDAEFKKFYGYLKNDVPFVFTLPAYIVGALMTYSGMLVRNAIINQRLDKIDNIHFRYFGKGGRLFEWLFFSFKPEYVEKYLNECFKVGLKDELINKALGRNANCEIKCEFDNCEDDQYGNRENSENKSEVARGLVSRREITGIEANREIHYGKRAQRSSNEYDARKQEVVGEVGIQKDGKNLDDLTRVDDNFYEDGGSISMPKKFENFTEFMDCFVTFVSQATNIYPRVTNLVKKIQDVQNVRSFIERDTEYKKYIDSIRSGNEDSYRMPVFIATALYYLEEVLLKEVFSNN